MPRTMLPAAPGRDRGRRWWPRPGRRRAPRAAQLAAQAQQLGAAPLVERALPRRRTGGRRTGGVMLLVTIVLACAGIAAWLAWREPRDEEYARLRPEPDEPHITPAGSDGPAREAPRSSSAPAAPPANAAPAPARVTPASAPEPVGAPANGLAPAPLTSGPAYVTPVTAARTRATARPAPPRGPVAPSFVPPRAWPPVVPPPRPSLPSSRRPVS